MQDKSNCRFLIYSPFNEKDALATVFVDHKRGKTKRAVYHSRGQDASEAILF